MLIKKHLAVILFFISSSILAQVSNVEGIDPMEGVAIPKAPSSQQQATKPGTVFKDCDDCPEMVVIPAGSFLMGSPPDPEQDPFSDAKPVKIGLGDEKPQHRVDIQTFAIGKYEVTQEQWYAVMGNNPSEKDGSTLPVGNVSWDDAQLFVQKLSQKTGKKYRLPSEAEWEYAARAGSTTTYPWGNSNTELHVYTGLRVIRSVGLKKPNQFGLYDMLGNVWEWTQDCWNKNYIGAPTDGSAWTGGDCSQRVLRGGSSHYLQMVRSSARDGDTTTHRFYANGFRVAVDISPVSMGAVIVTPDSVSKAAGGGKPSDSYLGRLSARVKPNITFSDSLLLSIRGNPAAEVEVIVSPSGQIIGMKLTKSSGSTAWDQAVLKAIEKTETLPRDENGKIPPKIPFVFRPRE
jgi:TonB family protein